MMKKLVTMSLAIVMIVLCSCEQQPQALISTQPGPIQAGENIAVVPTEYGKVRGYIDDGIYAFKGIPYAKAERFMPPQAPDKWDDVRQCTIYGPQAMQPTAQNWRGQSDRNFGMQFSIEPMDEKESFVLNVWSKGINDGKKRPVWVWLHGGGYSGGSGNQFPYFDGRSLAEKGDIVVVTVNHRLNVLGYVDLSGLGGKYSESVNLGMQDLVAALQWVNNNIENFGGDPNSVTIDGQSGGGGKVSTLMAMPSAVGLFHRAIIQSGSYLKVAESEPTKAYGLAFVKALGITPDEAYKLNDFSYEELARAERGAMEIMTEEGYTNISRIINPTVDGKYIVQHPFDPAPPEFAKNISMIIGCNKDENRTSPLAQASIKHAQGAAPVYVYWFQWQSPVNDGSLGSCHGMELPFVFNNIAMARTQTGGGKDAYEMADKISSSWINFVKTGDPNCEELPEWTPYTPEKEATMIFDNNCKMLYTQDEI
ncbi:MAG TPA: carboxylesterase family protein [Draconibacterium sp.]|nr:carboxylesterase family protein [Draconibacterium sp.]